MDHWGDPWAENHVDDQKSPTKNEVTTPPPLKNTSAPVLLNGFLDDAGWGNEDDGFGEWATPSGIAEATEVTPADTTFSHTIKSHEATSDDSRWDTAQTSKHAMSIGGNEWSQAAQDNIEDLDNVLSETSDSSATIQLEDVPSPDTAGQLRPDDDSSARASTSPSETSHNEAPVESPRTSIEEDRMTGMSSVVEQESKSRRAEDVQCTKNTQDSKNAKDEAGHGHISEDGSATTKHTGPGEIVHSDPSRLVKKTELKEAAHNNLADVPQATVARNTGTGSPFVLDAGLLDKLLPAPREVKEVDEAADDPIHSTSARKAWYRLTRKQTLREYNSGAGGDNHIRVTWANSQIRSEVNKIVGRWAREDRISGTGPGARASFYWDTPASVDLGGTSKHARTQSSLPTARTVAPVRQSLPPLSTNTPAAFLWSSSSASLDPWKHNSPSTGLASSPTAFRHIAAEEVQRKEVVFPVPTSDEEMRKRTLTPVAETLVAANPNPLPVSNTPLTTTNPLGRLGHLDTDKTSLTVRATQSIDDDDDWGEMVSSPTVSTPTATDSTSLPTTRDNTLSTAASTPHSAKVSPAQDQSPDSMHASPIVRLKSTISPTSALFGAKSFVPLSVEQVPIGPGLLKPAKRSVASIPETSGKRPQSSSTPTKATSKTSQEEGVYVDEAYDASAQQKVLSETLTIDSAEDDKVSTALFNAPQVGLTGLSAPSLPAATSAQLGIDAWADADFSFFESVSTSTIPVVSQPKHGEPGSSSVLETPQKPTDAACSLKAFTRSPPRSLTPPPSQPLTGATNSAQKRKSEEDQVIREILGGLPDLSYMLR